MRFYFSFLFSIILLPLSGQNLDGRWYGELNIMGNALEIQLDLIKNKNDLSGALNIPAQGAQGLVLEDLSVKKKTLLFALKENNISYRGTLEKDSIIGTFSQNGFDFTLNFGRLPLKESERPQNPVAPFPYTSIEVRFKNIDGLSIAGTLSLPEGDGPLPAVILISGSGAQNRDEEILGHKPFWVMADYLSRAGIAVLRYDDRGTAESEGDYATADLTDFKNDAQAALNFLMQNDKIDGQKIGFIGHSEGGLIAPMLLNTNTHAAFAILLAGPALPGDSILLGQKEKLLKTSGVKPESIKTILDIDRKAYTIIKSKEADKIKEALNNHFKQAYAYFPYELKTPQLTESNYVEVQSEAYGTRWFKNFVEYDPSTALKKSTKPMLALFAEKDWQVLPTANANAAKRFLADNAKAEVKIFEGLNHLFQECETGSVNEYEKITQTIAPRVLLEIKSFIEKLSDKP